MHDRVHKYLCFLQDKFNTLPAINTTILLIMLSHMLCNISIIFTYLDKYFVQTSVHINIIQPN